ncbi:MAG: glycosyltransferase [Xanthomonadales bacterium]|nr:glycosyltransferase [Xanthomonadales bacterium]
MQPTDPIETSDPARLPRAPVLSVLLLAYNHEDYLAAAIDSVLQQVPGMSLELLIGEDGSRDRSLEIAQRYQRAHPQRIRLIASTHNVGAFRNHRRLVRAARGRWIAHLDGDDYWLPGKLERQMRHLHQHPDCVAVYANARVIDRTGREIGLFNDLGTRDLDLATLLRHGNCLNTSSMVVRREVLEELVADGSSFIDYRIHLHAATHGPLHQIGEPLCVYRHQSATSMVHTANDHVRELYFDAITAIPADRVDPADLARGLADFLRRVVLRALRLRRPGLLRQWWPRGRAHAPVDATELLGLTAVACLRAGCGMLTEHARRLLDHRAPRILYRR